MRFYRVAVVVVCLAVAGGLVAGPREKGERPRDRGGVVKIIKKIVRSLGDGITIPTPVQKP